LAISADGGSVVFSSNATDLVSGDTNGTQDVFLRDLARGATRLVSATADGDPGNGSSGNPRCSGSGRFVAFSSTADDLVPGDTNAVQDVFVRDLRSNRTVRASVG
jgi:TolB protein